MTNVHSNVTELPRSCKSAAENMAAELSKEDANTTASYVAPAIRDKFETLSVNLKNTILERNVQLNTMQDLIHVLEEIVAEAEQ